MIRMMTVLMLLPGLGYAAPAFEQDLGLAHQNLTAQIAAIYPKSAADCPQAKPMKPWQGQIVGAMNHSCVELIFDRPAGTIMGGINNSPAEVTIDRINRAITGGANHSDIKLTYQSQPGQLLIKGEANRSLVQLDIDWANGTLEGFSNNTRAYFDFDLDKGTVVGEANHSGLSLTLDKASGKLTGSMNNSDTEITLMNLSLYDFIEYFYLFLNTR